MKTLVTGGSGFAGSYLGEYLLQKGHEVILVQRRCENTQKVQRFASRARIACVDLRDKEGISNLLREMKPERIFHLGAMSSPTKSLQEPALTYDVNFGGTLNLLTAWRQLEFDCRFLYVGSAEVYGSPAKEDLPLREDVIFRPLTPYAGSKAAAEMLALQFFESYALPIVRARPFNHTGPRQSAKFVCSSVARQVAEIDCGVRPPVISVGNIKVRRDFSDVRDIVRGYDLVVEKGKWGEVYQLCSGCAVSIEEIVGTLSAMASKPIEIVVDETKVRPGEVAVFFGDPSKVRGETGWETRYALETTLRDLKCYWDDVVRTQS